MYSDTNKAGAVSVESTNRALSRNRKEHGSWPVVTIPQRRYPLAGVMLAKKYTQIKNAVDFTRAFGVRDYAALGRVLAELVQREKPFSRGYVHHVLHGDYAPSLPMQAALNTWTAAEIERRTRGKFTASLYINGRWKVSGRKTK